MGEFFHLGTVLNGFKEWRSEHFLRLGQLTAYEAVTCPLQPLAA